MPSRRCIAAVLLACSACSDREAPRVVAEVPIDQARDLPGVPPPRIDRTTSAGREMLDRRARSIARLRAEGVPVIEGLPVIEGEAECRFRTRDEIVDRAVALLAVASRAAGDPDERVSEIVARYDARSRYSPEEAAFMTNPSPSEEQRIAVSWRFEALLVLAWALGYVPSMPSPATPTDGADVYALFGTRTLDDLRSTARVRSPAELLDFADLVYRYHWATTDAWVNSQPPPAGVAPDVIGEWHQAINWLIGYQAAQWDDVPTDT